ncbi:phosphatase [Celerinatantimonas diazotrophica]|uniref:Putative hydrolase n=1 Tax=Celerinatantimonas diazotrophica TaxID=412034 RepID=A0A4R1K448_9GAMM|nr:phosphatase [Celerinatantimonas diazotrophica]TCK58895.1 putative hydrolase [Celerinatantimonas diazotrophica]CAG9297527.1 putative phosphatase YcdX [Celerinatantimonas diazotrophica]
MQIETDTHTHTISSGHAYSSLAENVAAAKAAGIKLMAMTDHAPSMPGAPHLWHFGNLKVVPRIIDGVGVLRGVEANICHIDGEIDVPEKLVKQLDLVIGSLHEPIFAPNDEKTNTQALINAMKNGLVDVIGHPGNPNYPIDINAVVEAAAHYRVLIELNNSSFLGSRRGSHKNCLAIAEAARDSGTWITLGSDSHIAYTVGQFAECIDIIEQVQFPLERLVSTHAGKLLDFLAERGKTTMGEYHQLR